ncbi:uncharacterized protein LOC123508125 isoform X1 [Portunus trituberculatus]|uniref:uncharacterized protein LOC123508125 isoform X1 n=1 Tax=Portunus trituberculatus TaxID=210409 RepID=UPI001E1CB349|nr:uncharacterized protein LOC123508125 isoform X1 [Portunus trituberculatus]
MIVTHLPTDLPPSANDQTLNTRTRPMTQQPPGTHFHKLFNKKQMPSLTFKKLAKNMETTEVSTKVSEFENLKTLMNNLRQILGHTQPSNSISLLPSGHGPYCKGITITGPAHAIMRQMLTEASNAAIQLKNAAAAARSRTPGRNYAAKWVKLPNLQQCGHHTLTLTR